MKVDDLIFALSIYDSDAEVIIDDCEIITIENIDNNVVIKTNKGDGYNT